MSDQVALEFNRLRGRLCGLIESWGLEERQERAMIQTLKSLSYDSQKVIAGLFDKPRCQWCVMPSSESCDLRCPVKT